MPSFSVQDIINDHLKAGIREKKAQTSWHPSKLGSCLTGAYLERWTSVHGQEAGEEVEEFDERTLRVFSVGHLMENWLVELVKKTGITTEEQVRIELPEYNVTGYVDLVVHDGDKRIPYEIKSKHSKSFWYMDKKGEGASEHHKMQLWVYLKALNLPEGRLIYLSKDDLAILEYPVLLEDKKLERSVLSELEILNRAWKEGLPPQPITDKKDWRVKYCRWHELCLNQPNYLK